MIAEFIIKLLSTIVLLIVIIFSFNSLRWIWTHQIDVKESFYSFFRSGTQKNVGWFVTRDQNYIYQNGKYVGKISGSPEKTNGKIIFGEILDAKELNPEIPIEFRRMVLRIVDGKGKGQGYFFGVMPDKDRAYFMKDVVCEIIK